MYRGKESVTYMDNLSLETDGDLIQKDYLDVPIVFVGNLGKQAFRIAFSEFCILKRQFWNLF